MRILVVYNSALEGKTMSGVLRYYEGLTKHWIAAGHPTDFLTARAAWPMFRTLFPNSNLLSSDNFFDFTKNMQQTWKFMPAFAWRMATCHFTRLPFQYDIVIACAHFIFEVYPAIVLARRLKTAAVSVRLHHVLASQRAPLNIFDRMHFWSERQAVRLLNRHGDSIVSGTRLVANDYTALEESLGLKPSRIYVSGCGIDLDVIRLSVDAPKTYDAVLLGRLHETKGIFDAPAVWTAVRRRLPGARLLLIGEGPHGRELARRFEEAGLADSVHFAGAVSDSEKNALLAQAKVGLSLSREEGWGLSVTEFLGAGLPVVAMDLPVFHEIFPGQFDLVPMGDTNAVANRLLYWLEHPAERRERGIAGRAFVARYENREMARLEMEAYVAATEHRKNRLARRTRGS